MEEGRKNDTDKIDWTLLLDPCFIEYLEQVVAVLDLGQQKYARYNWQALDKTRIEKAMLRHTMLYAKGDTIDRESGKSHLVHVITNCLFLLWLNDTEEGLKVLCNL